MSHRRNPASRETIAVQALHGVNPATGAVVPGIETATTFARDENYDVREKFSYARESHPTATICEDVINAMCGGKDTMVFNTGMTAIMSVFESVRSGEHIVAPRIMYHGARNWLQHIAETRGIGLSLFDQTEPDALASAVRPGETAIVWVETLINPTWDVIDIAAASKTAHGAGAILVVDATVSPPCTTDALALGADLVFYSATKYLGGHSDLTAGALVAKDPDARWREIVAVRTRTGGVLGPFDAWLLLRGMRTLFIRYERASANAMAIARHFEGHNKVRRVLYPGLESHGGHAAARRQMRNGFGGMLSLLIDGDEAMAKRIATGTRVFLPATSLGGVESLIEHRSTVEGPDSPVPVNLLRLSVGIEAVDDLIADLEQALTG